MGYSPRGQTQLSTHKDNKVIKDPLALVTGSGEADHAPGLTQSSRPFLSASLPCYPQADFPHGHTMAAMCLIWICFCSAFQGRSWGSSWLEFSLVLCFSSIHNQSVKMVLPSNLIRHQHQVLFSHHLHYHHYGQPPTFHLDYWSHLLTGPSLLLLLTLLLKPERYFKNVSYITSLLRAFQWLPISLE